MLQEEFVLKRHPDNPIITPKDFPDADAVFMLPSPAGRIPHPMVYTLLYSGVPLVVLRGSAYDDVLGDHNAIRVLPDAESMAEGLLRVMQEPLFSIAISMEGRQQVAERHTFSSFKHRLRMIYHDLPGH